jgi:hypothetical protein
MTIEPRGCPTPGACSALAEIEGLRSLVTRLTDKLDEFVRQHPDPGADAFAAVYCGRNFIHD